MPQNPSRLFTLPPNGQLPSYYDQDGDGLPDSTLNPGIGKQIDGSFESLIAAEFTPSYHISTGEQDQSALFRHYAPWTVTSTLGANPPKSYHRVVPLGLGTDTNGVQVDVLRIDYLSLWNADGGLVGGGGACFYSLFGLDQVIQQVSSHDLDAERTVMLVAAPSPNGTHAINSDYKIYAVYTAAHEGTFFDQSQYLIPSTPVPANNHFQVAQSLSKHSSYGGNPDFYPIPPTYFILATNDAIDAAVTAQQIDPGTALAIQAAADDTFYGCLVERFGDQGGVAPASATNVGEVSHLLPGNYFIQDDTSRALNLASKLTDNVF